MYWKAYQKLPIIITIGALIAMSLPSLACGAMLDSGIPTPPPSKPAPVQNQPVNILEENLRVVPATENLSDNDFALMGFIPEGEVVPMTVQMLIAGIQQVAMELSVRGQGNPMFGVLQNGKNYMVYFKLYNGVGFVNFTDSGIVESLYPTISSGGNLANVKTFQEFREYLLNNGWKMVNSVPLVILESCKSFARLALNATGKVFAVYSGFPALIVIPTTILDDLNCYPTCTQTD